jgi:hypothetical protein
MKALGAALVIAMSLTGAVTPAEADGRHGHGRGARFDGNRHRHFRPHHRHHRVLPLSVGPSVIVSTPVFAAPPAVYVPPPVAYVPPAYAPAAPMPVAPPPSVPRVVEFPTGRYELRGDGVYTPYTWVWVPNPPVAPPPAAPDPPLPPATAPETPPRPSAARTTVLYRWTDEQGVTTWTDSLEKVPQPYRGQASRLAP